MSINLNEAQEYREIGSMMPDGTFCWVSGKIRPGQISLPGFDQADFGLFKQSANSDVIYADWEFTVTYGPHTGSKIWVNTSIAGGQVDDKGQSKAGNISKSFFRAMVESAFGINPKDQSPQAAAHRNIPNIRALEGVTFAIRVGVEEGGARPTGGNYPDKNTIAKVILPDDPQYADMRAGKEIPPQPSGPRAARGNTAATGPAPAPGQSTLWQADAAAAAAHAAPAPAPITPAAAPAAGPAGAWTGGPAAPAPAAAPAAGPAPGWGNGAAAPAGGPQPGPAPAGPAPAGGPAWLGQ